MSNADVIYSHINAKDIEPIEVNYFDVLATYLINKSCKSMDMAIKETESLKKLHFEALRLEPKFRRFIAKKEIEVGIEARWWSEELFEKSKEEFMEKYL